MREDPNLIAGWCKRWPLVVGKLHGVDDVPAECKPSQPRDCEGLYNLIAKKQTKLGPRSEGTGKALGAPLFHFDIGAQQLLVFAKGHLVPPARFGELARQHVCSRYRKG